MNAYNRLSAIVSGPMLGIFLLGTLTKRTTATGCLIGAVCGMIAIATVIATTKWSFFWQGPIGVVATFAGGYLSSLFLAPPPKEKTWGLVMGEGQP